MEAKKIKTNHAFTKMQLTALNKELKKISNTQVIALKGVDIQGKNNISDIKILHTPFLNDVFLSFTDMSVPEFPKFNTYQILVDGSINYEPKKTMDFNSLADRVTFFSSLQPVEFHY